MWSYNYTQYSDELAAGKYVANNFAPYTVTDAAGKVLKRGLQRIV